MGGLKALCRDHEKKLNGGKNMIIFYRGVKTADFCVDG